MRVWLSKKENKNVLALVRTFTDPAFASVCQKGQAIRLQPLLVSAITPPPVESASMAARSEAATMAVTAAAAKGSLKPIIHKKGAAFDLSRPHKSRVSNFYLRPPRHFWGATWTVVELLATRSCWRRQLNFFSLITDLSQVAVCVASCSR